MWRRRRASSYRDGATAEEWEDAPPFDGASWAADQDWPKSAASDSSAFDNRPPGGEPRQLVGYRVIRMLGRGTRATVYLGHRAAPCTAPSAPGVGHGDAHATSAGEPGQTKSAAAESDELVALKVFHPATGRASIDLEVRVLTEISCPHVLGLTDIATTPGGGVVLVLPYLSGGTLWQLLERRGRLLDGEVVNILVPVIIAVAQLYRSGFRHGSLSSTRVMFDASGTPVVAGIGRVRSREGLPGMEAAPSADRGDEAEVWQSVIRGPEVWDSEVWDSEVWDSEIWQSVAALADEVLGRVNSDEQNESWLGLKARFARFGEDSTLVQATEKCITELFEWADPQAVAQHDPDISRGASNRAPSRIPGRTDRAQADRAGPGEHVRPGEHIEIRALTRAVKRAGANSQRGKGKQTIARDQAVSGEQRFTTTAERPWLGMFHLPTQLRDSVERALELNPVHMLKDAWRSMRGRTRRMLVVGGLVFTVLAAVLLAVPSHSQTVDSNQKATGVSGSVAETPAVNAGLPPGSGISIAGDSMVSAAERSKIIASDPLVAVETLLVVRQRCLRERSVFCLLEVVQENTALMDGDRARLRDTPVGHGPPVEGSTATAPPVGAQTHTATLLERSGDAALILWEPRIAHENQPVTVLMMRAETGWRLREIFDL